MLYVGIFDSQGNRSDLNAAVDYGKKNGKAIHVFGIDDASGKVLHQNFVPLNMVQSHGLKASAWLTEVSMVVGGKVSHSDGHLEQCTDPVGPRRVAATIILRLDQGTVWRTSRKLRIGRELSLRLPLGKTKSGRSL